MFGKFLKRHLTTAFLGAALSVGMALPACAMQETEADTALSEKPKPAAADADNAVPAQQNWALHLQSTFVDQYHPPFHSPYQGPNSLSPRTENKETVDVTLYGGLRLWRGAEFWVNAEMDQGFGLSNTLGAVGFTSGEAYKVGQMVPYEQTHRVFLRQTINLGGSIEAVEAGLNQLAGSQSANRWVLTLGKLAVPDIFDSNRYAHDPRHDFLNWSVLELGSLDYAANSWGYTYGAAAELYHGRWAFRTGLFAMSKVPNDIKIDSSFRQFQVPVELEERHQIAGRPGTLRAIGFVTRARMAEYNEATGIAHATGAMPPLAGLRRFHEKVGGGLNFEQQLSGSLGVFARAGITQGQYEAFDFTDINRTVSAGLLLDGTAWGHKKDTVGLAFALNGASRDARKFFAAGGAGILIGDGQLSDPGAEKIVEAYYSHALNKFANVSLDYQHLTDLGYNAQRGPVSVVGLRFHIEF